MRAVVVEDAAVGQTTVYLDTVESATVEPTTVDAPAADRASPGRPTAESSVIEEETGPEHRTAAPGTVREPCLIELCPAAVEVSCAALTVVIIVLLVLGG